MGNLEVKKSLALDVFVPWFEEEAFLSWLDQEGHGAVWHRSGKLAKFTPSVLMTVSYWEHSPEESQVNWLGSDNTIPSPYYQQIGELLQKELGDYAESPADTVVLHIQGE